MISKSVVAMSHKCDTLVKHRIGANEMSVSPVSQHPASVDAYIRHGWSLVPIPFGTKGPRSPGWNLKQNALPNSVALPPGYGIGLAHAYSGTMALDVDRFDRSAEELARHGINLQSLINAPEAVTIHSGNPGHAKLLYAMPFGLALPSRKLIDTDEQGIKYNYLDFRCATANGLTVQDVLPPSMHPTTGQPYRWDSRGHWTRLPIIPSELLALWTSLLDTDKQRVIDTGDPFNASWEEIKQALEHISPDVSRDEWVHVGMALHWAGNQTDTVDQALYLWNDWSRGSETKYPGERDILTQWSSFKTDKASSVKLGTLFHIARRCGYVRPPPDVSTLFAAVEPVEPDTVLLTLRPPAPEMQMGLWPSVLGTRAEQIGQQIGCDPLVPLFAGLAAVSGAADARTRLELLPGFKVPPVLWVMTIGDPAQKKSPASKPMMKALKELQAEDAPRYARELLAWEGKEAAYASAKKAFLEFSGSPDAVLSGDHAPHVPDLPPQPVPLRLLVSDITSQKLVRYAADRPHGLICHLDEMNAWIRKMTDKASGEDRSAWVVSYEADTYDMDRVGAGAIHCENLAVSIYGNVQPTVFRQSFAALAADGMLQRFIPVILRERRWGRGEPVPEYLSNERQWENTLRMVHALPAMTYRLDTEAFKMFREFQSWYEDAKFDERLLKAGDTYMTAFGKVEGTLGRLALLMHMIDSPFNPTVSAETMKNAILIVKGYVIPSYRYAFGEIAGGASDSFDVWTTEHIVHISSDQQTVTLRQIKRTARRQLESKTAWQQDQMVMDAMIGLEQAGWVTQIENRFNQGHVVWAINQSLPIMFSEYRTRVIKAKQRQRDYIYRLPAQMHGEAFQRKVIKGYDPETMDE